MIRSAFKRSEFTLKPSEIQKIIYATRTFRDRVLIKTLYYAGLRRFEACNLEVPDIHLQVKRIIVRHGKGNKMRVVPILDDDYLHDLKQLIGKRTEGPLFPNRSGNKNMSTRRVNYIVAGAAVDARIKHPNPQLKKINPHLFRHSLARHLKDQGYPIEFIQKMLGHKSFKTTMDSYGTLSIDDMQELIVRKNA